MEKGARRQKVIPIEPVDVGDKEDNLIDNDPVHELRERIATLDDLAFSRLQTDIEEGKFPALKLYFEYRFGRPTVLQPSKYTLDHLTDEQILDLFNKLRSETK